MVCQRCGNKPKPGGLHAHHFIRRRNKLMFYNPDNAISLCYGCHQYIHEHRSEEEALMIRILGEEKVNQLKANERITGKPDEAAIKLWLKQELKKFDEPVSLGAGDKFTVAYQFENGELVKAVPRVYRVEEEA